MIHAEDNEEEADPDAEAQIQKYQVRYYYEQLETLVQAPVPQSNPAPVAPHQSSG